MSEIAICVEHLSKSYRLGERERYRTLRSTLTNAITAPFRRRSSLSNGTGKRSPEQVSALDDVSFEVQRGDVVGIIGRNGAGKSTLLKILSRITEPTAGYAEIHGRLGSLLEVGTGFHLELTGRENIYLNGAILGMKKTEIERRFDEIVAFAEVDNSIDTPVKHYSSGMYLRLAFAVAAHLDPEILIVDEVLAVGDARFQEKCLGLMRKTATTGRTILFVSHNMAAIQSLCNRVVLLDEGKIVADGDSGETTRRYFSCARNSGHISLDSWSDRITTNEARLLKLEIQNEYAEHTSTISLGGMVRFTIEARFDTPVCDPSFGILVHNSVGDALLDLRSSHSGWRLGRVVGPIRVEAMLEELWLYPGHYLLSPWIGDSGCHRDIDYAKLCATLTIHDAPGPCGDLKLNSRWGKYWVPSQWTKESVAAHAS
jgi:lipopolysaccharide transport system ATP-binding protein